LWELIDASAAQDSTHSSHADVIVQLAAAARYCILAPKLASNQVADGAVIDSHPHTAELQHGECSSVKSDPLLAKEHRTSGIDDNGDRYCDQQWQNDDECDGGHEEIHYSSRYVLDSRGLYHGTATRAFTHHFSRS
jgi:hypothetical protein